MYDDRRSHGLWEKTAPPAPQTAALAGDLSADVLVVGGGYTGLSCALHLASAGRSVILLEGKQIGYGGAGRNVGLLNAGLWVMPDDVVATLGPLHGDRLLGLLGDGPALVAEIIESQGIACELIRNGTLHCAVGAAGLKEVRQRCRQWQNRQAPVELLDASETARRTGSPAYAGSLLDGRAGTLQPLAYARGLASAAIQAGARLFGESAALGVTETGSRWRVVTANGAATADWVVVATDAYSTGPWQAVRDEQLRLPYFNLATTPLATALLDQVLPGKEGVWDTKTILSSFRLDKAGRLIFGSVGALRNTGLPIHKAWARRSLARLLPQLGDVDFEHEWYGKIGMTSDAIPRFHMFAPRMLGFSGYNGRGIAPGTVFGRELALVITGKKTVEELPLPQSPVGSLPFRAVREAYYEAGAQVAHLL